MGEFELIRNRGYHLRDNEGSMTSRGQLAGWLVRPEIVPVQPHTIPNCIFGRIAMFHPQLLRPGHVGQGVLPSL